MAGLKRPTLQEGYRHSLRALTKLLGPAKVRIVEARLRHGRKLNLKNPTSLADKVSWLEFNTDQTLPARLSDKIAVRDFVEERGLQNTLIPTCSKVWRSADEIDFTGMPKNFVMKASHGSGMNRICKNFNLSDVSELTRQASNWLQRGYARAPLEPHYQLIRRGVYCEEYIGGPSAPVDYKFHCIDGVPHFVMVTSERNEKLRRGLYDLDWNPMAGLIQKSAAYQISRPPNLSEMTAVARTLSAGLPFVRVDLYSVEGRVYFGELTFSPTSGIFPAFTDNLVAKYGRLLDISA